jgi:hypothetical protein
MTSAKNLIPPLPRTAGAKRVQQPRLRDPGAATKSRNGCLTCRRRHVKCDETRPACRRCNSYGARCGYQDRKCTSTTRSLLPAPLHSKARTDNPNRLLRPSTTGLSGDDVMYFDIFRIEVVNDVSSLNFLAAGLWGVLTILPT